MSFFPVLAAIFRAVSKSKATSNVSSSSGFCAVLKTLTPVCADAAFSQFTSASTQGNWFQGWERARLSTLAVFIETHFSLRPGPRELQSPVRAATCTGEVGDGGICIPVRETAAERMEPWMAPACNKREVTPDMKHLRTSETSAERFSNVNVALWTHFSSLLDGMCD